MRRESVVKLGDHLIRSSLPQPAARRVRDDRGRQHERDDARRPRSADSLPGAPPRQRRTRHVHVVERQLAIADHLRLLVPLPATITRSPGRASSIARAMASPRSTIGSTSGRLPARALRRRGRSLRRTGDTALHFLDDPRRVFAARVVGGDDHDVAHAARRRRPSAAASCDRDRHRSQRPSASGPSTALVPFRAGSSAHRRYARSRRRPRRRRRATTPPGSGPERRAARRAPLRSREPARSSADAVATAASRL